VLSILVVIIVRGFLVMLFLPFSALDKILNFKQSVGQAEEAIPARSLATMLILLGLGIEVVMSVGVLTGVADRLAAFILGGYCIVTAILWKPFWKAPDFRLRGQSNGREMFWDFLKNFALAGGFLLLAFGTGASSVQAFVDHPFASTHPYTAIE
jgi:putative oxidoreductase